MIVYEFSSQSPLYLQLAAILESAILSGEFEGGQKLPSVRELAISSRMNPNTVSRALNLLEDKGLIETRRTAGKFVTQNRKSLEVQKTESANALCDAFFEQMNVLGFSAKEALDHLQRRMQKSDGEQNKESSAAPNRKPSLAEGFKEE